MMVWFLFGFIMFWLLVKSSFESFIPINLSTRFTKGMSYDLRGDPCIIRPTLWSPWGISSWAPYGPYGPYGAVHRRTFSRNIYGGQIPWCN